MKRNVMAGAAMLCGLLALEVAAEVIQSKERTYAVKYKDEALERYVVKWTANFTASVREEGGGMIPYQGAVETRRCAWTITSTIDRTVSLATRLGQTIPLAKMTRTIDGGSPSPATGQRAETCSASRAAHEGEIASARSAVLANFERLTNADLESLRKEAQASAEVASVTLQ